MNDDALSTLTAIIDMASWAPDATAADIAEAREALRAFAALTVAAIVVEARRASGSLFLDQAHDDLALAVAGLNSMRSDEA